MVKQIVCGLFGVLLAGSSWASGPRAESTRIIPGQVLVKFSQAQAAKLQAQARERRVALTPQTTYRKRLGATGWTLWTVPESTDTIALAERLRRRPDVAYAQPVHRVTTCLPTPNDFDFGKIEDNEELYLILDWDDNYEPFMRLWPLDEVNAMDGWSVYPNVWYNAATKPRRTPMIAVIDSGCDMNHPEFKNAGAISTDAAAGGQLEWSLSKAFKLGGIDYFGGPEDENGHGTHVAGTALAAGNNGGYAGHGMIGIGYNSRGMILKVVSPDGSGSDADVVAAMLYAADHGADIINLSLGTPDFSVALQEAVTYCFQKGCVVVAAANESGSPANLPPNYPSACSGAIAVTAAAGSHIPASNYAGTGNYIDVAAPGGDLVNDWYGNYLLMFVFSTMPTYHVYLNDFFYIPTILEDYTYLYGTSMATPHVSGALGQYFGRFGLSQQGGWANVRAMQALQKSAVPFSGGGNGSWGPVQGFGNLDLHGLLTESSPRSPIAGSIEGIVYAGTPFANAVLRAVKGTTTVTTNSTTTGLYRFFELAPGTWTVTAKAGFLEKSVKVVVKAGCEVPGVDFWCGGNPSDSTPPTVGRFAIASAPTANSVSVRHWGYDTESGIEKILLRVGTTRGASNIKADTEIVVDGDVATLTGLSLTPGTTYWIRGTYINGAGSTTGTGLSTIADVSFVAGGGYRTVSGTVALGDFGAEVYGRPATIEVCNAGSGEVLETHLVKLGESGEFSFGTTRTGSILVAAKASHWVRRQVLASVPSGGLSGVNLSLENGDVDGDNAVTVFDYNALSDAFDTDETSDYWNPEADLDGDGGVTVFDYNILSTNFDVAGD